jgi:hypothetical protein
MFHMSNDSHLFKTRDQLESEGFELGGNVFIRDAERFLPLYEAKMVHHFDHRWATYEGADTRELTEAEKCDPGFLVMPRYWVAAVEVDARLPKWRRKWLLGFRDIARATDERTTIAGIFPRTAVGNKLPELMLGGDPRRIAGALAAICSLPQDYAARQKVGGTTLNFFLVQQFAVPTPAMFDVASLDLLVACVLELTYTANDIAAFAEDLGYMGPPFRWVPERRALIRAELDAAMFRLYGIEREDVDYILDTFPIIRQRDEERFGEYRTKRLVSESFDRMVAADEAGVEYAPSLDPPPGVQRHEVHV